LAEGGKRAKGGLESPPSEGEKQTGLGGFIGDGSSQRNDAIGVEGVRGKSPPALWGKARRGLEASGKKEKKDSGEFQEETISPTHSKRFGSKRPGGLLGKMGILNRVSQGQVEMTKKGPMGQISSTMVMMSDT